MFAEVPRLPDEDMVSMSLLEHLEDLRSRILKALYGFGAVFVVCLLLADRLFEIVMAPGWDAMHRTGIPNAGFVAISLMEQFQIIYMWTPTVAALFLGSPWILWQVWAFIAPGLYRRERKWAIPFVLSTAGLFIAGGLFGYFIAFRNGIAFLLGIGKNVHVLPLISIADYFETFIDLLLAIGVAFEIPVLLFFLTLIRVASPVFLWKHSRYAILAIVIVATIVTPTTDAFNLMLFAVPMCALFFVGILASYLLVLKRERRWPFQARVANVALIPGDSCRAATAREWSFPVDVNFPAESGHPAKGAAAPSLPSRNTAPALRCVAGSLKSAGLLEEPQPEILLAGAVHKARLEAASGRHLLGLRLGKRHAQPGLFGRVRHLVALHLKLEQRAGPEEPPCFTHVVLDDFAARDVLKHDKRIGEIEFQGRNHRKIVAVVLINVDMRQVLQRGSSLRDHLAADVHRVHFAEDPAQSSRHPARPAADFRALSSAWDLYPGTRSPCRSECRPPRMPPRTERTRRHSNRSCPWPRSGGRFLSPAGPNPGASSPVVVRC